MFRLSINMYIFHLAQVQVGVIELGIHTHELEPKAYSARSETTRSLVQQSHLCTHIGRRALVASRISPIEI